MKKEKVIKNAIPVMVFALLTVALLCLQNGIAKQTEETLPYAISLRSEQGLNLSFEDRADLPLATGLHIEKAMVGSALSSETAEINLNITDENFDDILPIDIIRGSFFFIEETPLQNKFIVISDLLAVKFFRSEDVVGNSLLLNGEEHTICGVYRADNSFMSELASNGLDSVYLPYKSVSGYETLPVHMLYLKSQTRFIDSELDKITAVTGKPPLPQFVSNYKNCRELIAQTDKITLFFIGLFFICILLWGMVRAIKKAYRAHKADEKKSSLIALGVGVGCVIAAVMIWMLVSFTPFIPVTLLPSDNIFDLGHYFKLILEGIQSKNGFPIYDFLWNYSFVAMTVSGITAMLTVIAAIVTAWLGIRGAMRIIKED